MTNKYKQKSKKLTELNGQKIERITFKGSYLFFYAEGGRKVLFQVKPEYLFDGNGNYFEEDL